MKQRLTDEQLIRGMMASAMKRCAKRREQIAEEMSLELGHRVSPRMLDNFAARSADNCRFPASWLRAFCVVTGNWSVFHAVARRAGFRLVGPEEERLLEIGRAWEQKQRAEKILAGRCQ